MALASEEIGSEDATVVADPWHLLMNLYGIRAALHPDQHHHGLTE